MIVELLKKKYLEDDYLKNPKRGYKKDRKHK